VHRLSGGIPRLINLICDRALVAGFSMKAQRITPDMVKRAAKSLDFTPALLPRVAWLPRRGSLTVGAAVVLIAATLAVGATALLYAHLEMDALEASAVPVPAASAPASDTRLRVPPAIDRRLPHGASLTILTGSYPVPRGDRERRSLTQWLEASGYRVYYAQVDLGTAGVWQRVLAGAYSDPDVAEAEAARMNIAAPALEAKVVTSDTARGTGTHR
jgi:hypothetical protein